MNKVQTFALRGGENHETPAVELKPGEVLFSENYESTLRGGYKRMHGYERFDGQLKPSEAAPAGCAGMALRIEGTRHSDTVPDTGPVLEGAGTPVVDFFISPANDGDYVYADPVCFVPDPVDPGKWDDNADGWNGWLVFTIRASSQADYDYLITDPDGDLRQVDITDAEGNHWFTWQPFDPTHLSTVFIADYEGPVDPAYVPTEEEKIVAIEAARAAINPVPGEGIIRGLWVFHDDVYTVRDNVGGANGLLYKSTPSGWELQDLGVRIPFDTGTGLIKKGETVTGETSGATGVITAASTTNDDWLSSLAEGNLYLHTIAGVFQSGETVSNVNGSVVATGGATANALAGGAIYRFITHNFYATTDGDKFYACNGKDLAWSWDGEGFAFIETGIIDKFPTFIAAHNGHLFLTYPGGSLNHSQPGLPHAWDGALGASEIGLGCDPTGMLSIAGGPLAIWCRSRTQLLYGTSTDDWDLRLHSHTTGAIENTVANLGNPKFLADEGLMSLNPTDAYGDFVGGTFSFAIHRLLDDFRTGVTASLAIRLKNQYRIFREDGYGLSVTFTEKGPEFMRFLLPITVRCTTFGEESTGKEVVYFGSDDGYVYQMDSGTSFDGVPVEAFLRLAFGNFGTPQRHKRFRKVVLEVEAPEAFDLHFTTDFSYGDQENAASPEAIADLVANGGYYGSAFWQQFQWTGPHLGRAESYVDGSGTNLGISVRSVDAYRQPHTIEAAHVHYAVRGRRE